ncbi:MAG: hypothetical protein JXQ73_21660 [Phycisphaerae bacterium]|nr:hypothetical protein [Phycisphaerae bacterium]
MVRKAAFLPLILILVGIGQVIYGAAFHAQPVLVEQEVDQPPPPPPFFTEGPDGQSYLPPPPPPPPLPPEPEVMTLRQSEPSLIREVTVGGVIRLASGELMRTYSGQEQPSLCPT